MKAADSISRNLSCQNNQSAKHQPNFQNYSPGKFRFLQPLAAVLNLIYIGHTDNSALYLFDTVKYPGSKPRI